MRKVSDKRKAQIEKADEECGGACMRLGVLDVQIARLEKQRQEAVQLAEAAFAAREDAIKNGALDLDIDVTSGDWTYSFASGAFTAGRAAPDAE